jgi:hypothetical protein
VASRPERRGPPRRWSSVGGFIQAFVGREAATVAGNLLASSWLPNDASTFPFPCPTPDTGPEPDSVGAGRAPPALEDPDSNGPWSFVSSRCSMGTRARWRRLGMWRFSLSRPGRLMVNVGGSFLPQSPRAAGDLIVLQPSSVPIEVSAAASTGVDHARDWLSSRPCSPRTRPTKQAGHTCGGESPTRAR